MHLVVCLVNISEWINSQYPFWFLKLKLLSVNTEMFLVNISTDGKEWAKRLTWWSWRSSADGEHAGHWCQRKCQAWRNPTALQRCCQQWPKEMYTFRTTALITTHNNKPISVYLLLWQGDREERKKARQQWCNRDWQRRLTLHKFTTQAVEFWEKKYI